MATEVRHEFIGRETVKITAYIYNDAGTLTDPTSVSLTITSPTGVKVVDAQAMTNDSTGVYSYLYRTAITTTIGQYTETIEVVDGAGLTAITTLGTDTFVLR